MTIKIHFFLIMQIVYLYIIKKLDIFLMFYIFAIIHEFAHVLISFALKVKIEEIILLPVGVTAKYNRNIKSTKEILIAASGPICSIVIGILSNNEFVYLINIFIAILNLIPIYPLDGGRVLRGIFQIICGYKKSIIISEYISKIFVLLLITISIILIVYFKEYSCIIFSLYVAFIMEQNIKYERAKKTMMEVLDI